MKQISDVDARFARAAISSGKASEEESAFLDKMCSLNAAREAVSNDEYSRLQRLTGGTLSTETPICER